MGTKKLVRLLAVWTLLTSVCLAVTKDASLPYNFRVIDQNVCAGGHPLGPVNGFGNSEEKALSILFYLKSRGVKQVIDLENTKRIQARYQSLLDTAGLKRLHIPMHASKVPNKKEWELIKEAMKNPVYIHCKWGADRTGAVIGRYLVEERGYTPEAAYKAVTTGGEFAGPLGGLKTGWPYHKLKDFIY